MERTDAEILARIKVRENADVLGFGRSDLIECLTFEAAQPFLREGVTAADWKPAVRDAESVKARMLDYMPFAWEKANGRRGLSAGRSLQHMAAWLWLLGREADDFLDDYDQYGKPQLRAICEAFGWDWRQWDDGEWVNSEDGPSNGVPETVPALPTPRNPPPGRRTQNRRRKMAETNEPEAVDPRAELARACEAAGGQSNWATANGISAQYVNDVLRRGKPAGNSILHALGLKRIVVRKATHPAA